MKTLKCPMCRTESPYVFDKGIEDIGGYAFDCPNPKCGEEFFAPKDNPNIKEKDISTVNIEEIPNKLLDIAPYSNIYVYEMKNNKIKIIIKSYKGGMSIFETYDKFNTINTIINSVKDKIDCCKTKNNYCAF